MDEPAFLGCIVKCRVIGVIEGKQGNTKKPERNDRIVAVEIANHQKEHNNRIDSLGEQFVKELEEFLVSYHNLPGKEYRVLDVKEPGAARKCVEAGMKAVKKR
jgi:inorganic pyrophosphatase